MVVMVKFKEKKNLIHLLKILNLFTFIYHLSIQVVYWYYCSSSLYCPSKTHKTISPFDPIIFFLSLLDLSQNWLDYGRLSIHFHMWWEYDSWAMLGYEVDYYPMLRHYALIFASLWRDTLDCNWRHKHRAIKFRFCNTINM